MTIPKKEPTQDERIEKRLQIISKKAGIPTGLSYNKMLGGYRLTNANESELSKRYPAKEFLDILDVVESVLDEQAKYDSAEK